MLKLKEKKNSPIRVRRCARPINLKAGNERIVLCIHGFLGYPGEMAYPAAKLFNEGWDVRVPRLSGHGTCAEDLKKSRLNDWRRQIADEWLNLNSFYRDVRVLGHSMGGLLALDLAAEYPVKSLVLMAPAILVKCPLSWRIIFQIAALLDLRIPKNWNPNPEYTFFDERDPDDDNYLGKEYWSWLWPRKMKAIFNLRRKVQKKLKNIDADVLGLFGDNDRVVDGRGKEILQKNLRGNVKVLELDSCGHYIPYEKNPESRDAAMDAMLRWFGN